MTRYQVFGKDAEGVERKADAKRKQRELEADGLMWDNPAADRLKF